MKLYNSLVLFLLPILALAQTSVNYNVNLENRIHHEAEISITMDNLPDGPLTMLMSRSSPGRYALHEFAKNVYNVEAVDSKGNFLEISRPDPHSWLISGHDRFVKVTYTLFGDRGDGTYSEFDATHAHMNIPATFMYPKGQEKRPVKVKIDLPEGWKVATQLFQESNSEFSAPDRYYFMDSPIEVSNFMLRVFETENNGKTIRIRMALHHDGSEAETDEYFESVKKIVEEQKEVFGTYPDFDFDEYTFLVCYMPEIDGDGMEHRNSTVVTSSRTLANGGMTRNLGTISHEFFHAWNVERIRPESLEPFNFQKANMSGELWFAEGFTSYYTGLILCRAGLIEKEDYLNGIGRTINAVVNGTGRNFFNPIEMSYRAPFVDAARSVDPTNTRSIFISYYTYGSALGLALDLSLRGMDENLDLDGYMKKLWQTYGSKEIPYQIDDLRDVLADYAGADFADKFFNDYIYKSGAPDYKYLLSKMGISLEQAQPEKPWLGINYEPTDKGWKITAVPTFNGPSYLAGLAEKDVVTAIMGKSVVGQTVEELLENYKPGDSIEVSYLREGKKNQVSVTLGNIPSLNVQLLETKDRKESKLQAERLEKWLN